MALRTHRKLSLLSVLKVATLTVFISFQVQAEEFCSKYLPLAKDVEAKQQSLSIFGRLIAFPGLKKPMIDIGAKTILTIEDGTLVPFDDPPLDLWNRLLPVLVRWPDGEIWAYSRVRPGLYRFDVAAGAFIPLLIETTFSLRAFAASGTLRRHEDRRQVRSNDGNPPLYAFTGLSRDRLVELTREGVSPVSLPETPGAAGWTPITSKDIGTFLPVKNEIWFRHMDGAKWHRIAQVREVRSLYKQSPFSMFQVHVSETGALWVMLEDRVLVGRLDDPSGWPKLNYQLAGDIFIHEPTGQVLVFANDPLSLDGREKPPLAKTEDALYEARPVSPMIVPGFRTTQQNAGSVPLKSALYHEPSGLTLIAHAKGIAGFNGKMLQNLPGLASDSGETRVLRKVGDRYLIDVMGGGIAEIRENLSLRPINLPEEETGLMNINFSPLLSRFIRQSSSWKRLYTSSDLVDFAPVSGEYEPIRALVGDLPEQSAFLANSAESGYLIQRCSD